MLLIIPAVIGTLGGLWHGGALANFARLRFRWPLLFLAGLLSRWLAYSPIIPGSGASGVIYVLALICLFAGMLVNRQIVGLELILIGLVLNAAVILANGGAMPVSPDALRLVGHYEFALQLAEGPVGHSQLVTPETRLFPLADIVPLSPLPLLRAVVSIGDLGIAAGVLVVFYAGTLYPASPRAARQAARRAEQHDPGTTDADERQPRPAA